MPQTSPPPVSPSQKGDSRPNDKKKEAAPHTTTGQPPRQPSATALWQFPVILYEKGGRPDWTTKRPPTRQQQELWEDLPRQVFFKQS
jgi:hypothetical protein